VKTGFDKWLIQIIFLVVFIGGCISSTPDKSSSATDKSLPHEPQVPEENKTSDYWVREGVASYEQHNYEDANRYFDKAIGINPQDTDAWYNKGRAYEAISFDYFEKYKSGNLPTEHSINFLDAMIYIDKAMEYYEKAVEIDPQNAKAWYRLGVCHYNLGYYRPALNSLSKAVEFDPQNAEAWNYRGNVLYYMCDYNESLNCYNRALLINHNAVNTLKNRNKTLTSIKNKLSIRSMTFISDQMKPKNADIVASFANISSESRELFAQLKQPDSGEWPYADPVQLKDVWCYKGVDPLDRVKQANDYARKIWRKDATLIYVGANSVSYRIETSPEGEPCLSVSAWVYTFRSGRDVLYVKLLGKDSWSSWKEKNSENLEFLPNFYQSKIGILELMKLLKLYGTTVESIT